jgi:2-octaprenyl-6-methoxyphenol hydroxylase
MSHNDANTIQIAGCGLTGMIMALSLAHHRIPSTILERSKSDKFPEDVRTTAFTSHTKQFLESVGIWDLISDDASLIKDINLHEFCIWAMMKHM